jgi:predicted enzyme related to lactoylglutathione lyase
MHVTTPDEGGRESGTVSGILFHCPDPVAAYAAIQKKGGTIADEPRSMQRGQTTIIRAVIAHPDGNQFILSSRL